MANIWDSDDAEWSFVLDDVVAILRPYKRVYAIER